MFSEALALLRSLSAQFPQNAWLLSREAECYDNAGDVLAATASYRRLRSHHPLYLRDMDRYAMLLDNCSEVQSLSQEMLRLSRQRPESWVALGRYLELKRQPEPALDAFERALSIDELHAAAYAGKGLGNHDSVI